MKKLTTITIPITLTAALICLLFTNASTSYSNDRIAKKKPNTEMAIIAPDESEAGNLVLLQADVPEGASLDWAISPTEADACFYVDTNGRTAVFASPTKGTYTFALAVSIEGKATCLLHSLQNGTDPEPDPEPDPDPDPEPDPDPGKRFVLIVSETANRTPEQAATLMGLRNYLQDKEHVFRFADPDIKNRDGETPEWFTKYKELIKAANVAVPAMVVGVLSDDGLSVSQTWVTSLPGSTEAAVGFVQAKGG